MQNKIFLFLFLFKRGIIARNIEMAQFRLARYANITEEISYVAGNYTQLKGIFYFERLIGYAIMQIYVPSICVVMVSWISLWVNRTAIPARVALCITTLLTISSFWSSINGQLPRVNYVKAIDIFMLTSFTCVIMTLVEFTFVINTGYLCALFKRPKRNCEMNKLLLKKRVGLKDSNGNSWPVVVNGVDSIRFRSPASPKFEHPAADESYLREKVKASSTEEDLANKIEYCARLFFPLSYASFLLIYFGYYLNLE